MKGEMRYSKQLLRPVARRAQRRMDCYNPKYFSRLEAFGADGSRREDVVKAKTILFWEIR